ncbi:MAG: hypothetical protein GWO02_16225, partial [Gammaproteobacteria bacterium]|nr:hypothetical protein [Gammaproteobacteria bacterium]
NEFQRSAFGLSEEHLFALNIKDGKAYIMRFERRFYAEPERKREIVAEIRERLEQQLRQYVFANEIDRLRAGVEIEVVTP